MHYGKQKQWLKFHQERFRLVTGKKNLMMKDNETLESIVMVELAGQDAQMRQELHRYSLFF